MIQPLRESARTALTVLAALTGAGLGWALGFPGWILTGPALFVSLLALSGLELDIAPLPRQIAFVVLGVGIGATVDTQSTALLLRWPLAFVVLALLLLAIMWLSKRLLMRGFAMDARSAVLASAPGHLSFVIGLGAEMNVDLMRITVVQSVRLLLLTLAVPLIARLMGIEMGDRPLAQPTVMPWTGFALLLALGGLAGFALAALRVPAAMLIGAMGVSAAAHGSGVVTGGLNPVLGFAALVLLGGLIGTRFRGIGWRALRAAFGAGLAMTALAVLLSAIAAVPVAVALGMPAASVLAAFAPGGFETMIALGAVMGGNAGFVATAHFARLMILTVLIPLFLRAAERGGGQVGE